MPQKYCNEVRQWCSKRGSHAGRTSQPVRLAGTRPAQSPSHYNHKKDAAYLTFSSSFCRRKAKTRRRARRSRMRKEDLKSSRQGLDHVIGSFSSSLGEGRGCEFVLTFSCCCLGRRIFVYFLECSWKQKGKPMSIEVTDQNFGALMWPETISLRLVVRISITESKYTGKVGPISSN